MKKQILNLGKALNKAEQKTIKGGTLPTQSGGLCDVEEGRKEEGCPCNNDYECQGLCSPENPTTQGYSGTCVQ
jgi:hypothetical protein